MISAVCYLTAFFWLASGQFAVALPFLFLGYIFS